MEEMRWKLSVSKNRFASFYAQEAAMISCDRPRIMDVSNMNLIPYTAYHFFLLARASVVSILRKLLAMIYLRELR
jgi:hypothetical protein